MTANKKQKLLNKRWKAIFSDEQVVNDYSRHYLRRSGDNNFSYSDFFLLKFFIIHPA